MDQVNLLGFQTLENWHDFLYNLLLKPVPESHLPVTMFQVWHADKQLWARMAESTRGGIQATAAGIMPLTVAIADARADPIVMAMLQPLPRGGGASVPRVPAPAKVHGDDDETPPGGKKKRVKGKGKGGKNFSGPMPKALQGLHSKTIKGDPICFNFNLAGCSAAKPGQKCVKGYHICAKCRNTHSLNECRKHTPAPTAD
jgi:hypothetical protein